MIINIIYIISLRLWFVFFFSFVSFSFSFLEFSLSFLGCCYAATQLALQVEQKRTHVVCSNREARKRPARGHSRNGPWT